MCACRSRDAAGCAERYVAHLPGIYGVVRRRSWRHTFTAPEQFTREIVSNALAAYLDETQDAWQPALDEQELREAIEAEQAERQRLEEEAAARERTLRESAESSVGPTTPVPLITTAEAPVPAAEPAIASPVSIPAAELPIAAETPLPSADPTVVSEAPIPVAEPLIGPETPVPVTAPPAAATVSLLSYTSSAGIGAPVPPAGLLESSADGTPPPSRPIASPPPSIEANFATPIVTPPETGAAEEIDPSGLTWAQDHGRDAQATQPDEPHGVQTTP